jgi:hypothetical protein
MCPGKIQSYGVNDAKSHRTLTAQTRQAVALNIVTHDGLNTKHVILQNEPTEEYNDDLPNASINSTLSMPKSARAFPAPTPSTRSP